MDEGTLRFTSSLDVDGRMAFYDIMGSLAHVRMLKARKIIPEEDADALAAEVAELPRSEQESLMLSLVADMERASDDMDFERAARLRDQVVAIRTRLEGTTAEDVIDRLKRTDRKGSAHATRRRYNRHAKH